MSAAADPLDTLAPERRLSGATLVVIAFVTGTLFALLPMYYLYTTRGSGSASAPLTSAPASPVASDAPVRDTSSGKPARFAARMTYELSHTPAEPPPAPLRVVAKAEPVAPRAPAIATPVPVSPPRSDPVPRVANARPIIASPPDPRDTTREMEREARRPEYREPPRQVAQVTVETLAQPKVIEGRDIVLPPKSVPTRSIAPPEKDSRKRAPEAPNAGRTNVATATVVPGTSPIAPPPEAKAPAESAKAQPEPAVADMLASRLTATREWLTGAAQTTHTIQIMGSGSEEQMRSQLKTLGKVLEPGKLYVIRTVAHGKPSMTVLYGAYPDKAAAAQALEKLPPAVAANKPVLRTVNGIRAEQKQHGTS